MSTTPEYPTTEASVSQNLCALQGIKQQPNSSSAKILRIHPVDAGTNLQSINAEQFVFGRNSDCEMVVDESLASRQHAKIVSNGANWFVVDLGSTNGTWVNEERVDAWKLESGDRIRIGRWIYKFLNGDNVEAHYHESVYQMMTQDALTGAWNKRYFTDVLEREIQLHHRTHQPLSLLMLDFDNFKAINDNHGHVTGDEVLAEFGRRIDATKRANEIFTRFGGDEFAIILLNCDHEETKLAAERFFKAVVSSPFVTSSGEFDCCISAGFAISNATSPKSADELLEAADQKLYEAKKAGRNQIVG